MVKKGTQRKDKPVIAYKTRGDKKYGLQVAGDPELLDQAVNKLQKDVKSAGDTSEFNTRTWRDYHDSDFLTIVMLCPVDATKMTIIGAILKYADYRSARN